MVTLTVDSALSSVIVMPECAVVGCTVTKIKARGMCRNHYEAWRESPESAAVKVTKSAYPSDDGLVEMFRKWDNKAPACASCNSSKREKDVLQFMLWRQKHV